MTEVPDVLFMSVPVGAVEVVDLAIREGRPYAFRITADDGGVRYFTGRVYRVDTATIRAHALGAAGVEQAREYLARFLAPK